MYKIGELSSLSSIPVKTLRYYDSEGILSPVYIDDFTGYRYYSASQLGDCYKIVALKALGFTLDEIKKFLNAADEELPLLLDEKEKQLEKIRMDAENSIGVLQKLKLSLKENESMYNIVVRKNEPFTVAFIRKVLGGKHECENLLQNLKQIIDQNNLTDKTGERTVIIDYCTEYHDDCFDIGAGIELKNPLPKASGLKQTTICFNDDTVNLICGKEEIPDAVEAISTYIADNNYQVVGPRYYVFYKDGTVEIKIPVIQLKEFNPELKENTEIAFENDPDVIGKWEMVDCVPDRECFNPECIKTSNLDKAVKELYFLPEGEKYWCFGWTKGYLLSKCGWPETINCNRYEIERIDGTDYLFIWFKATHYYQGGKPEIWVLRRLDNKEYSRQEIIRRDEIPDLPADDNDVLGSWKVCGLVREPEDFTSEFHGTFPDEALYWRKIDFCDGGKLTNIFGSPSGGKTEEAGAPNWRWVNGYVICENRSTASRYLLRKTDGKICLFVQWKSGDYIYGREKPYWYVFEKSEK